MTLPALEEHIQKAHTPIAETILVNYVYDIKNWLEPYLNGIKNMFTPIPISFLKKREKYK